MKNSNNLNNEKPYYSFSDYAKNKFKMKVGKISINTDFGCAHKLKDGGCRFCNLESYKPPYIKEDDIKNQWLNGVKNYMNADYKIFVILFYIINRIYERRIIMPSIYKA